MYITIDWDDSYEKGIIKSEQLDLLRMHFSVEDKQASIKKAIYGRTTRRKFPSRKHIITETGRFDICFFYQIVKYLKELTAETTINLSITKVFEEKLKEFKYSDPIPLKELVVTKNGIKHPLRPYQRDACVEALKFGRGIILLSTAGGKSVIIGTIANSTILENPKRKIFISVPTVQLVEQTYSDLISYGVDPSIIGKWSGDYDFEENSIMVVSTGILYSYLDNIKQKSLQNKSAIQQANEIIEKETNPAEKAKWQAKLEELNRDRARLQIKAKEVIRIREYLSRIDVLIVDECHKWKKGSEIEDVFKHITTPHIYGLTGTMPEDLIDEWSILGKIGPVIYTVPREELVDNGFISDCEVTILALEYDTLPDYDKKKGMEKYQTELEFLETNPFRNEIISKICTKLSKNILITVNRLDHVDTLYEKLSSISGKVVHIIKGEVEVEVREEIRKLLELGDHNIVIAMSKIFSTGISIDNLHYIILANAGKAKVSLIQSIGRSVRLHENKSLAVIFDLASSNLQYESAHMEKRITEYEKEGIRYKITKIKEKN